MNLLTLADVPSPAEAARRRPALEQALLQDRRDRRLALGPHMTLLFESRLSVLWQVLEMCRVEHISRPEAIQHELDTYNALLPDPETLSATLLIEYADPAERDPALRALVGLHEVMSLVLGGRRVPLRFDADQYNADRVSSVQFVRVPLDAAAKADLANLSVPALALCEHPAYPARVALPLGLRAALVQDLADAAREAP